MNLSSVLVDNFLKSRGIALINLHIWVLPNFNIQIHPLVLSVHILLLAVQLTWPCNFNNFKIKTSIACDQHCANDFKSQDNVYASSVGFKGTMQCFHVKTLDIIL